MKTIGNPERSGRRAEKHGEKEGNKEKQKTVPSPILGSPGKERSPFDSEIFMRLTNKMQSWLRESWHTLLQCLGERQP
jgi:hypothetical protein